MRLLLEVLLHNAPPIRCALCAQSFSTGPSVSPLIQLYTQLMNTGSQQMTVPVNKEQSNPTRPCCHYCLWSQLASSFSGAAGIHFPKWFSFSPWGYLSLILLLHRGHAKQGRLWQFHWQTRLLSAENWGLDLNSPSNSIALIQTKGRRVIWGVGEMWWAPIIPDALKSKEAAERTGWYASQPLHGLKVTWQVRIQEEMKIHVWLAFVLSPTHLSGESPVRCKGAVPGLGVKMHGQFLVGWLQGGNSPRS